MDKKLIKHNVTVSKVANDYIETTIAVSTACDGCHAKSSCGTSSDKTRIIRVPYKGHDIKLGDHINIIGDSSMGLGAVFFAYILPFLLVMASLIISLSFLHLSDTMAGALSLLVLPIYYFILFLFKHKFEQKYTFRIAL